MKYIILVIFVILGVQNVYSESGEIQQLFGDSAIAVTPNALIYKEPNINSDMITEVFYLNGVQIIRKTNVNYRGSNQLWYYVNTQSGELIKTERGIEYVTFKGWMRREDLAGWGDFKPVKKMQDLLVISHWEWISYYYRMYSNGTFKTKITGEKRGLDVAKEAKMHLMGRIYNYKNVFLLVGNIGHVGTILYYRDGQFFTFGEQTEVLTNPSTFPAWAREEAPPALEDFYIVTGDNVNVRTEANTNAAVLTQLSKGYIALLLKRSDVEVTIGDKKGFWAYVDTGLADGKGDTIKGWVFDYYLKKKY